MAPSVVRGDVRDLDQLAATLKSFRCEAVLHFAGLKSISASFEEPTRYYDYNVVGSLTLVKAMQMAGVRRLIFSSSATVYGEPLFLPLTETHPLVPSSVYPLGPLAARLPAWRSNASRGPPWPPKAANSV